MSTSNGHPWVEALGSDWIRVPMMPFVAGDGAWQVVLAAALLSTLACHVFMAMRDRGAIRVRAMWQLQAGAGLRSWSLLNLAFAAALAGLLLIRPGASPAWVWGVTVILAGSNLSTAYWAFLVRIWFDDAAVYLQTPLGGLRRLQFDEVSDVQWLRLRRLHGVESVHGERILFSPLLKGSAELLERLHLNAWLWADTQPT